MQADTNLIEPHLDSFFKRLRSDMEDWLGAQRKAGLTAGVNYAKVVREQLAAQIDKNAGILYVDVGVELAKVGHQPPTVEEWAAIMSIVRPVPSPDVIEYRFSWRKGSAYVGAFAAAFSFAPGIGTVFGALNGVGIVALEELLRRGDKLKELEPHIAALIKTLHENITSQRTILSDAIMLHTKPKSSNSAG